MIGNTRKPAKAGDKLIYGGVWNEYSAKRYNELSDRIQSYIDEGREPPERWLNARHKLYIENAFPA